MRMPAALQHGNWPLLASSALALSLKVLSSLCLLAFNLLVVHYYQPGLAGAFFLCVTLVLVASQLARFGMDNVLVRHVSVYSRAGEPHRLESIYATALLVTLFASGVMALLVNQSAGAMARHLFSNPGMEGLLRIMALAIPFYAICLLNSYVNQGLRRVFQYIAGLNLGQVTLASLLLVAAVEGLGAEPGADLLACCYVGGCALMMLQTQVSTGRQIPLRPRSTSPALARDLVVEAAPLYLTAITQLTVTWSSQFLLGVWSTPEDVAIYTVAQRVAMLTSFVLIAVNSVAAPRFAELYHNGQGEELRHLAQLSVKLMLLVATPLLLAMLLFPGPILSLFGPDYRAGAPLLMILAAGQFVNVVTGSVGYLLQMSGHYREVRNNTVLAAITALALNGLLTPRFGPVGAAIAAAIALALVNLLGVWQVRRHLGFNTLQLGAPRLSRTP